MAQNPSHHPLVSFLTVNFNQPEVTMQLVESMQQLTYPNWECVVVDNGSEPSPLNKELAGFSRVKYVKSEKNLGFAGGNNLGYEHCQGDYIFLINNDTELIPGFLEPLVDFADSKPQLGALSPKICYFNQPSLIQYAGSLEMNKTTIRNSSVGHKEADLGQYDDIRKTPHAHGAAMMVSRKMVEDVGLMYEDYFLYYEELDWSERIRRAGYEIWYFGKEKVLHKESVSTGKNSPLKTYYLTRNRLLFARRNYGLLTLIINYIYFTIVALPKNLLSYLLKGEKELARAFWRGYLYNITHSAKPQLK